jgi:hypothetical protein
LIILHSFSLRSDSYREREKVVILDMISTTTDRHEILAAIDETVSKLLQFATSLDDNKINSVPYKDSWTPGQLMEHVTKSTAAMVKAMATEYKPAERDATKRIPELRKIFLDFSHKLKSPDFIVPGNGPFEKHMVIDEMKKSFEQFRKNAGIAQMNELVEGLPLGPITKLEILHFVLYHTQRHLNQMERIVTALA